MVPQHKNKNVFLYSMIEYFFENECFSLILNEFQCLELSVTMRTLYLKINSFCASIYAFILFFACWLATNADSGKNEADRERNCIQILLYFILSVVDRNECLSVI